MTIVYKLTSLDEPAAAEALGHAAEVLRRGGLVAFPTETVYGLGANALDPAAVARIFAAKGRPANNPLIVHVAEREQAQQLTATWSAEAERLAQHFWPGPLTLVLPKRSTVPDIVTAGAATVAVRVPAHPLALALLRAAGLPIAAPSANRSNHLSPTTAAHVRASLGDAVDVILDGGPTSGGLESTVLDLSRRPPRLLRPGLVPPSSIEALIGPIEQPSLSLADSTPLPSPGIQPRHYAPRAAMECRAAGNRERVAALAAEGVRVGWLALGVPADDWPAQLKFVAMPTDPIAYAATLYAARMKLDDAGVERIVVDLPPDEERLASSPRPAPPRLRCRGLRRRPIQRQARP